MLIGRKPIGTIAYMGGVPTLPEPFVWSWGQMIQYNNDYLINGNESVFYDRATVSYHSFARNTLVQRMKGDWMLMLDTDHKFDPDVTARMLAKMNKYNIDVLVGLYLYKFEPHSPVLYRWNEENENLELIGDWDKDVELFEVGSSGGGCLLVKKSVFDRIKKELKEEPFDIIPPFSEDHSFFQRLRKLGIKAYCDPSIEFPHLTFKALTLKDYDKESIKLSPKYEVEGLGDQKSQRKED